MLQIIGFIYGLVALITGKFFLGKGRKAVGQPARLAGLVLVVEPFVAFGVAFTLALAGVNLGGGMGLLIEVPLLIAAFVVAFRIAGKAAAAQQAGQSQTQRSFSQIPPAKAA